MEVKSQRLKGPDSSLSSLNAAIDTLDLTTRDTASVTPGKDVFGSASLLLTTIRVRFLPAHADQPLNDVRRIQ